MKKIVMMCAVVAAALCARAALPEGGPYTEVVDGIEWTFMVDDGKAVLGELGRYHPPRGVYPAISASTKGAIQVPNCLGGCSVRIGPNAFWRCKNLTSIHIPEGVTDIDQWAFDGCSSLMKFVVAEENTSYASVDGVLYDKSCAELIRCPQAKNGNLIIPVGVVRFHGDAFSECKGLMSVKIPATTIVISDEGFPYCTSLVTISVDGQNPVYEIRNGLLCERDNGCLKCCPAGRRSAVVIPTGIRSIGYHAFGACTNLPSITIPTSVEVIGLGAFAGCWSVKEIKIPLGVQRIEIETFSYCKALVSVAIPPSVTSIGTSDSPGEFPYDSVFSGCKSLKTFHVGVGDAKRIKGLLEKSGFDASGVTIIEDYEPEPGPTPPVPPEPEPEEGFEEAHTFNGLVYAGEVMCGIVQVTTGRRTSKDQVKVGGFVMLTDGKKQTIKSVTEDIEGGKLNVETKAGKLGEMELEITDNGFSGTLGSMTVKSGDISEDTGIISGTLKMSYFDAKTNKLKTRSIKLGGVASGGEATGTLETKGEDTKLFSAVIE